MFCVAEARLPGSAGLHRLHGLNLRFTTWSSLCQDLAHAWKLFSAKLPATPSSSLYLGRDRVRTPFPHLPPQADRSGEAHLKHQVGKKATLARKISESLGLIGDKIERLSINGLID